MVAYSEVAELSLPPPTVAYAAASSAVTGRIARPTTDRSVIVQHGIQGSVITSSTNGRADNTIDTHSVGSVTAKNIR